MDTKLEEVASDTQESVHTFLWGGKLTGTDRNPSFYFTTADSER